MPNAADQTRRNLELVAAHAAGASVASLAKTFGLGRSRIKEILAEARAGADSGLVTTAMVRLAEERRAEHAEVVRELRELSLEIPLEQAAAKVGAYRVRLYAMDRLTALEQALGYLPRELEEVGDDRVVLEAVQSVLTEYRLPVAAARALRQRLDEQVRAA